MKKTIVVMGLLAGKIASAWTIIGVAITVFAIAIGIACLLAISKHVADKAETIAKRHAERITNETDMAEAPLRAIPGEHFMLGDTEVVWEPDPNDPRIVRAEVPDDRMADLARSVRVWRLDASSDMRSWVNSGNEVTATPRGARDFALAICRAEAAKRPSPSMGFYRWEEQ